ncbi:class I SAM-dependent DNA methyltransferase [Cutibacterium sp. WCA-380-WT-3A]|uniref:site-specific DNA-methyltransferase (adenine-specific) n=1 Tax=Cutibacterium porci TaxID=2605781 RepID=A0A7K0J9C3_9ACTN|nr:class I SAM-dependent DNA methyltransferase [Cutibacterium porci]MSS46577.1 class I SAM-dependent DNA methyltransferase [Cutibacterium porci]
MPSSDALIVVEDWISEHFFTTDARKESFQKLVLDRRKQWDGEDIATTRSRFTGQASKLATMLAALYSDDLDEAAKAEATEQAHEVLLRVLGYLTGEFRIRRDGPVRWFSTAGVEQSALAVVTAKPVETPDQLMVKDARTLWTPWRPSEDAPDSEEVHSASRLVSTLFAPKEGPSFALVMAGRWLVVAEKGRWPEGRYLAVDVQTVAERADLKRGGEVDRALTCIEARSLAPDADGKVWWTEALEESIKHTVGVSQDLREGVRESIEIIANEVVDRRRQQGLSPLPSDQAQPLAMQSLRFLYRILFLLYAEASPELGVLPVGAPEYDAGYSLDRLRELVQVPLVTEQSMRGTHFYESLGTLFRLVDQGHLEDAHDATRGLSFHSLRADLFSSKATALIDDVGLGNQALQHVLQRLLLTKEQHGKKGRERGYISYAELGINQLGAVYESLMSYTGFFATEDLYEVAHDGNPEKGSWVVPLDRASSVADKDFVLVEDDQGRLEPRIYRRGQFVFRLSGRQRQQSASYYTPEVLTKFTVSQALEQLIDDTTTAEEILGLSVCEPALGSGAFAIEAVRQLAAEYLKRRQDERGCTIDPEDYPAELQRVKAYLALHNVYGVDLNATAVEFAEITLWLDTMAKGLDAPWFGLRLRRGNSLIGARRAVYRKDEVTSKEWLRTPPTDVPLDDLNHRIEADDYGPTKADGRIPHWLLPGAGWGATADSRQAKQLVPDRVAAVKKWRKQMRTKPTKTQLETLVDIGRQAEELWAMALRRLMVAEQQTRREITVWGREATTTKSAVTREQVEQSLADSNGAYRRLRRVMDAWCALWFWPLTAEPVAPPSWEEWIDACQMIIGSQTQIRLKSTAKRYDDDAQQQLAPADQWQALAEQESWVIAAGGADSVDTALERHPWLRVCEEVAKEQGFFHWQLDFAPVFAQGGFDLQVGNPPWVRPILDMDALFAEGDPWWQLAGKASEEAREQRRTDTLALPGLTDSVCRGIADVSGTSSFVGDATNYPLLQGLQPDLYRCFMCQTWAHMSGRGTVGLVHPETHFTDEKAGHLREETYPRLRRHWQFVNELKLFDEVHHLVTYGVHVYGSPAQPHFLQASALYHPDTVVGSLRHDGSGEAPGFKVDGHWDQRPHAERIEVVTDETLATWRDVLDPGLEAPRRTRMLYTVNRDVAQTLRQLSDAPRFESLHLRFSPGWHEKNDRTKGYFVQQWGAPDSWDDVILQGPHLHVATPFFKAPNPTMKHNQDWSAVDLETLPPDAIPVTSYKPAGDRARYDADYTHWDDDPARDHYRLAWRAMAANTGERTLIPAIIPPGTAHPNGVFCVGGADNRILTACAGFASSLLLDFSVRAAPKSGIYQAVFDRLPAPCQRHPLLPRLLLRTLRLNCLTDAYADLWAECFDPAFTSDSWTIDRATTALGNVGPEWTPGTPLRRAVDRRQALVEIDALVALMLGVTADQLCTVYRTQFAVLYGYDHEQYFYDAHGRLVPNQVLKVWRKKGDAITSDERTHTNDADNTYVYDLPFQTYDREDDMRVAYAEFEHRLKTQGPET